MGESRWRRGEEDRGQYPLGTGPRELFSPHHCSVSPSSRRRNWGSLVKEETLNEGHHHFPYTHSAPPTPGVHRDPLPLPHFCIYFAQTLYAPSRCPVLAPPAHCNSKKLLNLKSTHSLLIPESHFKALKGSIALIK